MTRAARWDPSLRRLRLLYRLAALAGFALVFVAGAFLLARYRSG